MNHGNAVNFIRNVAAFHESNLLQNDLQSFAIKIPRKIHAALKKFAIDASCTLREEQAKRLLASIQQYPVFEESINGIHDDKVSVLCSLLPRDLYKEIKIAAIRKDRNLNLELYLRIVHSVSQDLTGGLN